MSEAESPEAPATPPPHEAEQLHEQQGSSATAEPGPADASSADASSASESAVVPAPAQPLAEGAAPPERESGWRLQLPSFEGPLDLLLHLIEEHELNVMDIPIAFVATKYLEYITLMDELNIDVASEYLVMAATLTHIKSKMLLPEVPSDQEDELEAELDPRAELVRRLLEYQKYKHAAAQMSDGSVLGRDVFLRGLPAPDVEGPAPLAGLSLFKLLDAFQAVLARAKTTIDHQIDFERFSITDRINELSDLLRSRGKVLFEDLFDGSRSRGDLIVTFLALLEMTRLRLTKLEQDGPLAPIFIELAVSEDSESADSLANVASEQGEAEPSEAGELDAEPGDGDGDRASDDSGDSSEKSEMEPE